MQTSFLVFSVHEDGHETLEHETISFDDAVKEVDSYSCPMRIYAKVPITQYGERPFKDA